MDIILIRHGETIENAKGICQGQFEGTLSEKGRQENQILAEQFPEIAVCQAYTSPLIRAIETAKAIAEKHPELQFREDARLMEWHMGTLQTLPFPEGIDICDNPYQMESFEAVHARCISFLKDVVKLSTKSAVLIVSHGLTNKMLESILMQTSFKEVPLMDNSSYRIIHIEKVNFV